MQYIKLTNTKTGNETHLIYLGESVDGSIDPELADKLHKQFTLMKTASKGKRGKGKGKKELPVSLPAGAYTGLQLSQEGVYRLNFEEEHIQAVFEKLGLGKPVEIDYKDSEDLLSSLADISKERKSKKGSETYRNLNINQEAMSNLLNSIYGLALDRAPIRRHAIPERISTRKLSDNKNYKNLRIASSLAVTRGVIKKLSRRKIEKPLSMQSDSGIIYIPKEFQTRSSTEFLSPVSVGVSRAAGIDVREDPCSSVQYGFPYLKISTDESLAMAYAKLEPLRGLLKKHFLPSITIIESNSPNQLEVVSVDKLLDRIRSSSSFADEFSGAADRIGGQIGKEIANIEQNVAISTGTLFVNFVGMDSKLHVHTKTIFGELGINNIEKLGDLYPIRDEITKLMYSDQELISAKNRDIIRKSLELAVKVNDRQEEYDNRLSEITKLNAGERLDDIGNLSPYMQKINELRNLTEETLDVMGVKYFYADTETGDLDASQEEIEELSFQGLEEKCDGVSIRHKDGGGNTVIVRKMPVETDMLTTLLHETNHAIISHQENQGSNPYGKKAGEVIDNFNEAFPKERDRQAAEEILVDTVATNLVRDQLGLEIDDFGIGCSNSEYVKNWASTRAVIEKMPIVASTIAFLTKEANRFFANQRTLKQQEEHIKNFPQITSKTEGIKGKDDPNKADGVFAIAARETKTL